MKRSFLSQCARFVLAAGFLPAMLMAQAPAPAAILNGASSVPMALPGGSIAQGAIFVLYGKNMGGNSLSQASSLPLPNAGLNGTTITVTAGSTTLKVPLLYTLASQIAGILPSTTPVGNATLNVTYAGATGTLAFKVVRSSFGISTVDQSGSGAGVVTFGDISLVTQSKPTKSGDTLIIWGTGLGPTSVDDGIAPPQVDLSSGAKVLVAGKEATVLYAGRSAAPGLDQINFKVPDGVAGCRASLVVQIGTLVSNFTTLAIAAAAGEPCHEFGTPGIFGNLKDDYVSLLPDLLSKDSVKLGIIDFEQTSTNDATVGFNFAGAASTQAYFLNLTKAQLPSVLKRFTPLVSAGSCALYFTPAGTEAAIPVDSGIDAGSTVTLTPPGGAPIVMTAQKPGIYSQPYTTAKLLPLGAWGAANSGGSAVPSFRINMAVPQKVAWFNAGNSSSIDRTKGLVIEWGGADPLNNYIEITGTVAYGTAPNNGTATIGCTSGQRPLSFTIPPVIFQALPATANLKISLSVNTSDPAQVLQVPGTDVTLGVSHQWLTFDGAVK